MNRTTSRMMIAAAVLAVVTGIASAQSLNADIPFAFRFGKNLYPAGTYHVSVQGANRIVHLYNADTNAGRFMLPTATELASKTWRAAGAPALAFECGLGRCQLVQLWTGYDQPALSFARPRLGHDEVATLRLIHLSRANGD
jgi:hypothetical protein